MSFVSLADRQDITRAGMMYLLEQMDGVSTRYAEDKAELIEQLKEHADAVVVLDYTLFDINDADELFIFCLRFPLVRWVLFSEDLSPDFVRQVIATSPQVSVLLKESPMTEIKQALSFAL